MRTKTKDKRTNDTFTKHDVSQFLAKFGIKWDGTVLGQFYQRDSYLIKVDAMRNNTVLRVTETALVLYTRTYYDEYGNATCDKTFDYEDILLTDLSSEWMEYLAYDLYADRADKEYLRAMCRRGETRPRTSRTTQR